MSLGEQIPEKLKKETEPIKNTGGAEKKVDTAKINLITAESEVNDNDAKKIQELEEKMGVDLSQSIAEKQKETQSHKETLGILNEKNPEKSLESEDEMLDKIVKESLSDSQNANENNEISTHEKIAYAIKDFMDIYADIKKRAAEKEEGLPLIKEKIIKAKEARDKDPKNIDLMVNVVALGCRYHVVESEISRIIALADVFKAEGEVYEDRMLREYESAKDKGKENYKYYPDLMPRILGKIWKLRYAIHGTNIDFRAEESRMR